MNEVKKLNPPRKIDPYWWDKEVKIKKRRRRTAYKGIVTPEKSNKKEPDNLRLF